MDWHIGGDIVILTPKTLAVTYGLGLFGSVVRNYITIIMPMGPMLVSVNVGLN
jgi:hypothetical protein